MTIFIVDDEPKIRNGMGKLLSAHPRWQVQTFADAKSALHRLYEGEADVIITDIQMPDVSGLDMIEAVRQVNKTVPIEYNDYFRDTSTGNTYRVTSNPEERAAPRSAGPTVRALKFFTAERKELPK